MILDQDLEVVISVGVVVPLEEDMVDIKVILVVEDLVFSQVEEIKIEEEAIKVEDTRKVTIINKEEEMMGK